MSMLLFDAVWRHKNIRPIQRLVLLAFADSIIDDDKTDGLKCFIDVDSTAKLLGLSEKRMNKAIFQLQEKGLLELHPGEEGLCWHLGIYC